jgi:dTDP-4-amino-4,6-dideoxygalactose transaminase
MRSNKRLTKPTFVTQPFLPPLEEYYVYIKKIWDSKIVTNNGPFHQEFEKALGEYLGVKYLSLFSSGTMALIIALKAMEVTGEVITTPFSFVATSHALSWNGIKPVFVDVEPRYFTLDPDKIVSAITGQTTAILPVHVYGNPCQVVKMQKIADKYGLKLIYDAAHSFGVRLKGTSLVNFGDMSILSFHGTKVFNTFEGGAIVCHKKKLKHKIDLLKNCGIEGETTVVNQGLNAKMNEMQAALGILQLKYFDSVISKRKLIFEMYRVGLKKIPGITILSELPNIKYNYGYFIIIIDAEIYGITRDQLYDLMKSHNIYTRRYFYPLISHYPSYNRLKSGLPDRVPIAEKVSKEVLCLPIYPDLPEMTIQKIISIIKLKH